MEHPSIQAVLQAFLVSFCYGHWRLAPIKHRSLGLNADFQMYIKPPAKKRKLWEQSLRAKMAEKTPVKFLPRPVRHQYVCLCCKWPDQIFWACVVFLFRIFSHSDLSDLTDIPVLDLPKGRDSFDADQKSVASRAGDENVKFSDRAIYYQLSSTHRPSHVQVTSSSTAGQRAWSGGVDL